MRTKHYIVAMVPNKGTIRIIGPFASEKFAGAEGRRWQRDNGDNPCWQVVSTEAERLTITLDQP